MKKFLALICSLLLISLILVSCGGDTDTDTPQDSTTNCTVKDSSTPNGEIGSDDIEPDTPAGSNGEQNDDKPSSDTSNSGGTNDTYVGSSNKEDTNDTDVESSGNIDTGIDSSIVDVPSSSTNDSVGTPPVETQPDEDEDDEPTVPDGPIDIAISGLSSYVVVYDSDNLRVTEFAQKFVNYMQSTHKISLEMVGDTEGGDRDLCIYIGDVKGTKRVRNRLNSANDFGACVSGNDYVLYATNDRLYEYLYDILVEDILFLIRNGNWSTSPKKDFIYSQSEYKDISYVDYILAQNDYGLTKYVLQEYFEPRSYTATDGTTLPYRLYVPYDYDRTKEYPVLLFMHGAGERGNNNTGNMNHMLTDMFSLENSPLWDCIIIAPQCPDGQQWVDTPWSEGGYRVEDVPESNENKAVLEIVDLVAETFPTDKDRYYVVGLSMGGFAAWDLIMRHSDIFAAAVPLCGGADYTQASLLVDMPIYTIHDKRDADVPCMGTKEMVVALEILGSEVLHYEELSGHGHNVWGYAARKLEIWTWLFEQTREGR